MNISRSTGTNRMPGPGSGAAIACRHNGAASHLFGPKGMRHCGLNRIVLTAATSLDDFATFSEVQLDKASA